MKFLCNFPSFTCFHKCAHRQLSSFELSTISLFFGIFYEIPSNSPVYVDFRLTSKTTVVLFFRTKQLLTWKERKKSHVTLFWWTLFEYITCYYVCGTVVHSPGHRHFSLSLLSGFITCPLGLSYVVYSNPNKSFYVLRCCCFHIFSFSSVYDSIS